MLGKNKYIESYSWLIVGDSSEDRVFVEFQDQNGEEFLYTSLDPEGGLELKIISNEKHLNLTIAMLEEIIELSREKLIL